MVSGIEGVGEAVTGGMLARAVEPETGEDGHTRELNCLNCGAELGGPYCHRCGQKGHVHRTLTAFWHDLAHGVLHFEGKIWRTLPMLAWRPGELTRRYVHGERATFVSPIALFLFSVFLMFAVFSWVGGPVQSSPETTAQDRAEVIAEFNEGRREGEAEIAALRRERDALVVARRPTASIDENIRRLELSQRVEERTFRQVLAFIDAGGEVTRTEKSGQPKAARPKAERATVLVPNARPETSRVIELGDAEIDTGWAFLDHGIEKARDNPALLAYKLQTNAYKFSWALIPISVPFVWLLFLHRRRYRQFKAYDHTVFVTYSIAFMSLGLITLSLLRAVGLPEAVAVLTIIFVPPVHIYRQLRGAYRLSRFSALWRTVILLWFAFIAGTLFFMLLLAIGALG
jgi:uncharacterized protein DUF3667